MNIRNWIPALAVAGLGALAIAMAPTAAAEPSEPSITTEVGPNATLRQQPGDAELSATPPEVQHDVGYPFGADGGLLFHKGGPH